MAYNIDYTYINGSSGHVEIENCCESEMLNRLIIVLEQLNKKCLISNINICLRS